MRTFVDNFGNRATIDVRDRLPYKDATRTQPHYRLSCYADYDGGYLYHVSVHECEVDAIGRLSAFSCGTFKEI